MNRMKKFMDDCGKPFQREDFQYLIQHVSLSSERLKFKDFVNYMSDKKITSIVVTNRSRSNSPQKEHSRYTLQDSTLKDDSINPYQAHSFMNTHNSLHQRSAYDSRQHESPVKYNTQSIYVQRNTPSRVQFDKTVYSNMNTQKNFSPQYRHQKNLSQTYQSTQMYSPNKVQKQQFEQSTQRRNQSNSYVCANCSSLSPQKAFNYNSSVDYSARQTATSYNFNKSPTKNDQFEPSLFKDPSIYYKKQNPTQFDNQFNITLNNVTRIPKDDHSSSKLHLTNFRVHTNHDQDSIHFTPKGLETTYISPVKQNSFIHKQDQSVSMRQTDTFYTSKHSQYARNATNSIVEFLEIAKKISVIEEEIEDSKKQLARNLSFSPSNLFKAFDAEGQNYLRYSKFCELLSSINIKFTDKEIGIIFSRIETDKDGFLSKDEFNEVFKPVDTDYMELFKNKPVQLQEISVQESREIRIIMSRILERENALKEMMQQLRLSPTFEKFSIFSALDENQDGQINLNELAQAFRNFEILLKQTNVKLLFNLMDIDQNGLVRYAEFLEFIQA